MTKISVKNIKGENVKDINLNDNVWNIEVNDDALKKMIRLQLDSMRQGTRKTKTRSEVSGGGRKPWKQKGTGRARQGSIRATQWRGGGIAFGVNPRDYSFKINRKERVLALKTALTYKNINKELVVLDNINLDTLKTKEIINILETLKLNGKVLFVVNEENENLYLATRNLGNVLVLLNDEINAYDLTNADVLVCTEDAVNSIEEVLK
mgnify:CR=1 FL=1